MYFRVDMCAYIFVNKHKFMYMYVCINLWLTLKRRWFYFPIPYLVTLIDGVVLADKSPHYYLFNWIQMTFIIAI